METTGTLKPCIRNHLENQLFKESDWPALNDDFVQILKVISPFDFSDVVEVVRVDRMVTLYEEVQTENDTLKWELIAWMKDRLSENEITQVADLNAPASVEVKVCEGVLWTSLEPLYEGTITHTPLSDMIPELDWVVVGGESGPGATLTQLNDIAQTIDVCKSGDTPVFVKQLGSAHGKEKGGDWDMWEDNLKYREMAAWQI